MKENKSKEKTCLFFASDYHFEMISLPYINEKLKTDNNVVVITENDLEDSIHTVLSKLILKEEDKRDILNIGWKNDDFNKFKNIKMANEQEKDTIVFVKGKENYIKNVNKNLENWIETNKIKIIDCYDVNEVESEVNNITKEYGEILSTSGINNIN